jgi:hypothetical protein
MAAVAVDDTGTGFVGKGDLQTALGYANDAAIPARRQERHVQHHVRRHVADGGRAVWRAGQRGCLPEHDAPGRGQPGQRRQHGHGDRRHAEDSNGKVTATTSVGSTETTPSTVNWSKWATSCPTGEKFAGWIDPANAFYTVTTPGHGLEVSIGTKTAALPNTPAPVVEPIA